MPTLPPHNPEPPDLLDRIRELEREIRLLKERPREEDNPRQHRTEITFSYHGEVLSQDPSGRYLIKDYEATIHRLDWTARIAPNRDVECQVWRNGVVVYTFTIEEGETADTLGDLAIDVEEWDRIHVDFPDPDGSNLETVVLTFQIIAVDEEEYR